MRHPVFRLLGVGRPVRAGDTHQTILKNSKMPIAAKITVQ